MQFKLFALATFVAMVAAAPAPCADCHEPAVRHNVRTPDDYDDDCSANGDQDHDNNHHNNNDNNNDNHNGNGNKVQSCGNGGITSCCNGGNSAGGLIPVDLLSDVLSCTPILQVLGASTCSGKVACCQGNDQTGLLNLNLGCTEL